MTIPPAYDRISLPERLFLFVEKTCTMDGPAIAEAMGAGFGAVYGFNAAQGITPVSMPVALYPQMPEGGTMTFRTGFFLSKQAVEKVTELINTADAPEGLQLNTIPAGDAIQTVHVGSYADLNSAHKALWDYMAIQNITPGPLVWEEYIDDPETVAEKDVRTRITRMVG
ncbi:MAG: GyrI-like domain-containing protein [Pseudomonadota bacterium]